MAIEEEFAIEIPDEEADAITSVGQGEFDCFVAVCFFGDAVCETRGGGDKDRA